MKILVCIKQVPDSAQIRVHPDPRASGDEHHHAARRPDHRQPL